MNTFPLTISTPDGNRFDGAAAKLSLRGTEGELAVMAGHIPFVTAVRPGEFHIDLPDGSIKRGQTEGGILTVSKDDVIFLAGSMIWL